MKSAALSAASRKTSPELLGDTTGDLELLESTCLIGGLIGLLREIIGELLLILLLSGIGLLTEGDKGLIIGLDLGDSENVGGGGAVAFLNVATIGFLVMKAVCAWDCACDELFDSVCETGLTEPITLLECELLTILVLENCGTTGLGGLF